MDCLGRGDNIHHKTSLCDQNLSTSSFLEKVQSMEACIEIMVLPPQMQANNYPYNYTHVYMYLLMNSFNRINRIIMFVSSTEAYWDKYIASWQLKYAIINMIF